MNEAPLWVFGYGSLIWEPGFPVARREVARLDGWARSFCMRSIHHRGTVSHPGLVLALDRDQTAHCEGIAFRVADGAESDTLTYLRDRELISSAYLEDRLMVRTRSGTMLEAVTYVIDPDHDQYCGGLPLEEQAHIIASATGGRGPNWEYLFNTTDHLGEMGLHDPDLVWLKTRVHEILGR